MRHLVAVLVLAVALASNASAGSYTITTTAAQDARLERARVKSNTVACASLGLAPTCTQAQADAQRAGAVTIYADIQAFIAGILKAALQELQAQQGGEDAITFCTAWKGLTPTQQNNACTGQLGLAAGCTPCP